jgi:hypothetical protein
MFGADASVLELYLLVSMKRLEGKEQETNFNAIYKGEQSVKSNITGLSSKVLSAKRRSLLLNM